MPNKKKLADLLEEEGLTREASWAEFMSPANIENFRRDVSALRKPISQLTRQVKALENGIPFRSEGVREPFTKMRAAMQSMEASRRELKAAIQKEMEVLDVLGDRRASLSKTAEVKMQGVKTHSARGATLVMNVAVSPEGEVTVTAKRDQVDPDMHKYEHQKNEIRYRAQKLRKLSGAIKAALRGAPFSGTAEIGRWVSMEAWSNNSGYIVRSEDSPELAQAIAETLPKVFPITGGGVPGSTSYRGGGWLSKGPKEWVWEDAAFGIGD